jgi:hypothetical protein
MDIDFVAITGLGSRLFEDERICELLSGGQARIYPKCQREFFRRRDGGLIFTFGVIHLWALGKPLVRGLQLQSVDEDDETGAETQVHMRNHIDTQLKVCFMNSSATIQTTSTGSFDQKIWIIGIDFVSYWCKA